MLGCRIAQHGAVQVVNVVVPNCGIKLQPYFKYSLDVLRPSTFPVVWLVKTF